MWPMTCMARFGRHAQDQRQCETYENFRPTARGQSTGPWVDSYSAGRPTGLSTVDEIVGWYEPCISDAWLQALDMKPCERFKRAEQRNGLHGLCRAVHGPTVTPRRDFAVALGGIRGGGGGGGGGRHLERIDGCIGGHVAGDGPDVMPRAEDAPVCCRSEAQGLQQDCRSQAQVSQS